jgi:hypothetical protein
MKKLLFVGMIFYSALGISQEIDLPSGSNDRVIYKYKDYQKFDFEDLVIEGESGGPGDLSIEPRYQKEFKNPLPYRSNFNAEIRRSIERVR